MRAATEIDAATLQAQSAATNPHQSAWVSANAGSGKTFVLARRVIRLLLLGTDPSCILCLTFTKAAAAEMAKRVFADLGRWTTLPDVELAREITAIEGVPASAKTIGVARKLFAQALDTPGGLKIQTIHAFCERLLHQFPLEANVAGHFAVLDERNADALKDEARRVVLTQAADRPDTGLGLALKAVLVKVSDRTHEDSLKQFIDAHDAMRVWLNRHNDLDGAVSELRSALGVAKGETVATLRKEVIAPAPFDQADAARLLAVLRASGPNDRRAADRLAGFVERTAAEERANSWISFLLKADGEARANPITQAVFNGWPRLAEILSDETARLRKLLDRIRTAEVFEATAAMLLLADAATTAFERMKAQRGMLDFDDLIVRTANLLARADASRWVHYKLDRGIEHILVDEAQDTSPRQWQVIAELVSEFFAGQGVERSLRTLFAVGDEKQSIFSFQGAVPAWFARMRRTLGESARKATYDWADLDLHLSFRSVPKVLAAVDAVFASPSVHRGLTAEAHATVHEARRRNQPGRVVLWPRYEAPAKPEPDDWATPLDHLSDESPEVRLAQRIATTIEGWLKHGEILDAPDAEGKPRPIRANGILILTRSRGALTDAINRELKRRSVPIAGADRITLVEHIAVMDLMAVARVVLLPEDDLSLAAVLRSPLIGLSEETLFDLAHDRKGTLWESVRDKATEDLELAAASARIELWRSRADTSDPHAFFARILAADGGRRALVARLGTEADDVIDEFLAGALAYEQANVPSLEGFIAWLDAGETEVRRDPDSIRDEVRVMTVHGAKGLEADIVFLVDNGTPPVIANYVSRVVPLSPDRDPVNAGPVVWNYSTPAMPMLVASRIDEQKRRDEEEYRRLLYVGMTRARDRLYVVGMQKLKVAANKIDMRWHPIVERALADGLTDHPLPGGEIEREWRASGAPSMIVAQSKTASMPPELPPWARDPAPPPRLPRVRITPSSALGESMPPLAPLEARRDSVAGLALERGRLVHRLLQSLPDVAAARRAEIGARYLAAAAEAWSEEDRAAVLAEVLAVIAHPSFAPAFAPGSRAEVEISGRLGEAVISGRIDRLAVTSDRVLIVDYKTNRPAPRAMADVPPGHLAQLALYRTVLRRLYPSRAISAALLWTDGPSLMEVPEADLILAESRLAAP